jgi:hypothetical protein
MGTPKILAPAICFLLTVSPSVRAATVDKDGFLKDSGGTILTMTYEKAMKACPAGKRLGSARGTAKELVGSDSVKKAGGDVAPPGFDLVETFEAELHSADKFYFSNRDYRAPSGELGEERFWTSSAHSESDAAYAWSFDGRSGALNGFEYRAAKLAVRCVPNRI